MKQARAGSGLSTNPDTEVELSSRTVTLSGDPALAIDQETPDWSMITGARLTANIAVAILLLTSSR
jgi:hypothetical protein